MSAAPDHVIRLSLGWVVFGIALMVLLGIAGGVIAEQLFRSPLPPLTGEADRLVSTVQQVTISPSKAAADIVVSANRSVFLISRSPEADSTATGFVVTNDGVLVSVADVTGHAITARDHEGRALPLTRVGRDELYGLTYYQLQNSVIVPLDLRPSDVPVGYELLALGRSQTTYLPRATRFLVSEYAFPPAGGPPAIQRIMQGEGSPTENSPGSPLVDDEGKVAGLLQNSTGTAYPIGHLQASLARVTSNQREVDPFARTGLTFSYSFQTTPGEETSSFRPVVAAVAAGSPAAIAGIARGDSISAINDEAISWERPVAVPLSAALPLKITVQQGSRAQTLTVPAPLLPSPSP